MMTNELKSILEINLCLCCDSTTDRKKEIIRKYLNYKVKKALNKDNFCYKAFFVTLFFIFLN